MTRNKNRTRIRNRTRTRTRNRNGTLGWKDTTCTFDHVSVGPEEQPVVYTAQSQYSAHSAHSY